MKKGIMKKWVNALRSGEYDQCSGKLAKRDNEKNSDSFCCLGVLCNIMQENTGKLEVKYSTPDKLSYNFNGSNGILPQAVKKWSGITSGLGYFKNQNGFSGCLATSNDEGASFEQIADIIEKNYENL